MENRNRIKILIAGILMVMLLTGCKNGVPIMSRENRDAGYSRGQVMLLVVNEKNSYQSALTGDVWGVPINEQGERDPSGKPYGVFMVEQIKVFMQEMKTMNLLAQEQGITLTNQEISKVNEAARAYYDTLSEADLKYTKAKLADVEQFYQEYYLANKLVNVMTADSMVEVSDSDAKVIGIRQIRLEDEAAAQKAYEQASQEGADFELVGRQYSKEPVREIKIGRGEESPEYEEAAFSLEEGQISQPFAADGSYYILQCVDPYDQEATDARKAQMTLEQKDRLFRQVYNSFAREHEVVFEDELWGSIDISQDDGTTTSGLFTVYRQFFPE